LILLTFWLSFDRTQEFVQQWYQWDEPRIHNRTFEQRQTS
jgi:hypothetical protein